MNLSTTRSIQSAVALLLCCAASGCFRSPTLSNSGGTVLHWQVAKTDVYGKPNQQADSLAPQAMSDALSSRIMSVADVNDVSISPVKGKPGVYRIELIGVTDSQVVDRVKRLIALAGELEFLIVAHRGKHQELVQWVDDPTHQADPQQQLVGPSEQPLGLWVEVQHDPEQESNYAIDPRLLSAALFRNGETGERLDIDPTSEPQRVADVPNLQMLTVIYENRRVRGQDLKRAAASTDLNTGKPAISFTLTDQGAIAMAKLTTDHLPPDPASGSFHYLAIVLDGKVLSAPRLQSTISNLGQITGDFTQEEVDLLVGTLRSGRLPARMQATPLSEEIVEPEH